MDALQLTLGDVLTLLSIVAVGMLIVLLYHLIFASVNLRRTLKRMDDLSKDVESLILKPIGVIDYVIDWILAIIEGTRDSDKKGKHHK